MNATPTSLRAPSRQRPACRVICAWCEEEMPVSEPEPALTGTSHGICPACALKCFGIRLKPPTDVAS